MNRKKVLKIASIIYTVIMVYLLSFQRVANVDYSNYTEQLKLRLNLVPFRTVMLYLRVAFKQDSIINFATINLLGNVVMFVPMGIFLPSMFKSKRNVLNFIVTVIVMISMVEVIQLFTLLGSCDIDDLILNVVGATIGFLLWKYAHKHA